MSYINNLLEIAQNYHNVWQLQLVEDMTTINQLQTTLCITRTY